MVYNNYPTSKYIPTYSLYKYCIQLFVFSLLFSVQYYYATSIKYNHYIISLFV